MARKIAGKQQRSAQLFGLPTSTTPPNNPNYSVPSGGGEKGRGDKIIEENKYDDKMLVKKLKLEVLHLLLEPKTCNSSPVYAILNCLEYSF